MNHRIFPPRKALNKAYLKVKPIRSDIEKFKTNLMGVLDQVNESESEEFHKNLLSDFLKKTYYDPAHSINTKGRNDLVIHNGKDAKSTVGVILEAKKPANKGEMLKTDNLNSKAFQELVLYYLRERITGKNLELKNIVACNIYEWFIFDAQLFEKAFAQNKALVKQFNEFEEGRLGGSTTDFFYREIAAPAIEAVKADLEFTYFDIRAYETPLRNADKTDDSKLIALYKLLSPEHLLKLPFANDSNSLDKTFYAELLHIIGLAEIKEGGKKIIERKKPGERNPGSLLENAIVQLDSLDKISRLDRPSQYGDTNEERLFTVGLELAITWINRILFLKLLEAQLITYHKGDRSYAFLTPDKIHDYDDLNSLFFSVLAKKASDRNDDVREAFSRVPYLNSSLFEPTEMEHTTIFISNLRNERTLPVLPGTVLKSGTGKKQTGELDALTYIFEFLNAYDFSSEGSEEIQEDNKRLINASVLGLIFEKINGYKDGSFFTPGFITMYMCRETIRRAVVQKFREAGYQLPESSELGESFNALYDQIEDRNEANRIINSLKICDPAVGSGHFLVSALNEMIAIKSDLKVLQDREGRRLKEYHVEVVNDELMVTDEEGELFDYNPHSKESQRIQEMLFHEKQTIIENCLFGVDINPNSVKICRLRLWIELLKSAYYKTDVRLSGVEAELETLPNIDINIKTGNSLISRFGLDADIKQALKKSKWTIDSYRMAVQTYREAKNKDEKREMERLINDIKSDFRTEINKSDPKLGKLYKLNGELTNLTTQQGLFSMTDKEKKEWTKKVEKLTAETKKLETEIEEIKSNKIYENAFEWRFEFPEVLNEQGEFVGFDVVIGNPPYGINFKKDVGRLFEDRFSTFTLRGESYILFIEQAINLTKRNGEFGYIIPDTLLNLGFTQKSRHHILKNTWLHEVIQLPSNVFADATVDTILLFFQSDKTHEFEVEWNVTVKTFNKKNSVENLSSPERQFQVPMWSWENEGVFNLQSNSMELSIIKTVDEKFGPLDEFSEMFSGIKAYEVGKGIPPQTEEIRATKPFTSKEKIGQDWLPFFDGKHIGYFSLNWNEDNWIDYGPWLAAPRSPENFEGEKILIRKITGKTLLAHYISFTSYCNTLLFVLKLRQDEAKISYKALLGILNSTFIGWYYRKKFQVSDEDTFPQIMIRDILQFAVPNISNGLTKKIEALVESTIKIKAESAQADIADSVTQIDRLVYELYGLSEEEVRIVEGG